MEKTSSHSALHSQSRSLTQLFAVSLLAAALTACGGSSGGSSSEGGSADNSPQQPGTTDTPGGNTDSGSTTDTDNDSGSATIVTDTVINTMTPLTVGVADQTYISPTPRTVNGQLLADGNWIFSTQNVTSNGINYSSNYLSYVGIDNTAATPMTITGPMATLPISPLIDTSLFSGELPMALAADPSDNSVWLAYIRPTFSNNTITDTLVMRQCSFGLNAYNEQAIICTPDFSLVLATANQNGATPVADTNRRTSLLNQGLTLAVSGSGDHSAGIAWGYNIFESDNPNIATSDATDFHFRSCAVSSGNISCTGAGTVGSATRLNVTNLHVDEISLGKHGTNLGFSAYAHVNPYYAGSGDTDDFYESWGGVMGNGMARFADNGMNIAMRSTNEPYGTHTRASLVVTAAGGYLLAGGYEEEAFGDGNLTVNVWKDMHYCTYQGTSWSVACYAKELNLSGESGETFVGLATEPTLLTTSSQYLTDAPLRHRLETHTRMAFMSIWSNGSQLIFRPGVADLSEVLLRQETGTYAASNGTGLTISNATLLNANNYIASTVNFGHAQNADEIADAMRVQFTNHDGDRIAYSLLDNTGGVIVTQQPGAATEASELFRTVSNAATYSGSQITRAVVTDIDGEPVVFTRQNNSTTSTPEWSYRISE